MERVLAAPDDFSWKEPGRRIRERRVALGLRQDQLAAATGLSEPGLYRIEQGATNPQLENLQRIAAALDSSVRELLCGSPKLAGEEMALLSRAARLLALNDPTVRQIIANAVDTAEVVLDRLSIRALFQQRRFRGPKDLPHLTKTGTKLISQPRQQTIDDSAQRMLDSMGVTVRPGPSVAEEEVALLRRAQHNADQRRRKETPGSRSARAAQRRSRTGQSSQLTTGDAQ